MIYLLNTTGWEKASVIISAICGGLTLLISTIAIIIAINTTRKQNKITLFEQRFDIYIRLQNFHRMWERQTKEIDSILISNDINLNIIKSNKISINAKIKLKNIFDMFMQALFNMTIGNELNINNYLKEALGFQQAMEKSKFLFKNVDNFHNPFNGYLIFGYIAEYDYKNFLILYKNIDLIEIDNILNIMSQKL